MNSIVARSLVLVLVGTCGLLPSATAAGASGKASPRERMSFDADWRFVKGDPAGAEGELAYANIKDWVTATGSELSTNAPHPRPAGNLGSDVAYTQTNYNDSGWRRLNLPHDWAVEGPFRREYAGETGKLPYWGVGWYRKHFALPAADRGRQIYLDADGAMSYASVWLNGHYVGGWPYGYSSWRLDLTPYLRVGAENVIAIRLDNPRDSSRWYPGAGIYRNVWLVKTAPIHVSHWGITVTTPDANPRLATVQLRINVENCSAANSSMEVGARLYRLGKDGRPSGSAVASAAPARLEVAAGKISTLTLTAAVQNPRLWSPQAPNRYMAITTVKQDGQPVDSCETPFGIRAIRFTADNGFLLNGDRVRINGVCLHHDLGPLGAAFNQRAAERQLQLLKEMGCNAIRTSHNPPAPELLDLCDRLGFLVMDEAFDAWRIAKRPNDYHLLFDDWHEKDLRAMVRRDRNHPCVILWSIGNEIYEQREGSNAPLAASLTAIVHEEDNTRPVNMALHVVAASTNGFQRAVDVFGYNYTPFGYAAFRTDNPNIPLIGSETASCVSSRGEYFFPVSDNKKLGRADFQVTSYDLSAPSWAYAPDVEFKAQDENPFVAGEFVWTGFDYLGEPTPYDHDTTNRLIFTDPEMQARMDEIVKQGGRIDVPSRSSYFGIFDLCGFRKDRFYLYQSRWRPDLPMAHILPHWNWPERIGKITPVQVYTSGDEAELFLNGRSLGRKKKGPYEYRLRWDNVVYEPGVLKVVAYKHGRKWATDLLETTGPAAKLLLQADRSRIADDGRDLSFITVKVADQEGRLVPRSDNRLLFSTTGPGEIVATANGDATSHVSFQSHERNAFNGLCLVIVRAKPGEAGRIQLAAEAEGLAGASISLRSVRRKTED